MPKLEWGIAGVGISRTLSNQIAHDGLVLRMSISSTLCESADRCLESGREPYGLPEMRAFHRVRELDVRLRPTKSSGESDDSETALEDDSPRFGGSE